MNASEFKKQKMSRESENKASATRYLKELEDNFIEKMGTTGVGTAYVLKGLNKGS